MRRIKLSAESLLSHHRRHPRLLEDRLAQADARSREPFSLRETLQDVLDTVQVTAGEKALALHLDVLPAVPDALVGDALRLRQVLVNLIGNAIKFTDRGDVRMRVDIASQLPGEVCLHFAVIDTGIGIPRDKQELVFEAFAQADGSSARRYGGTGLGLSISARLVELMGGDIWVESEVGPRVRVPLHGAVCRGRAGVHRGLARLTRPGDFVPGPPYAVARGGPVPRSAPAGAPVARLAVLWNLLRSSSVHSVHSVFSVTSSP